MLYCTRFKIPTVRPERVEGFRAVKYQITIKEKFLSNSCASTHAMLFYLRKMLPFDTLQSTPRLRLGAAGRTEKEKLVYQFLLILYCVGPIF